MKKSIIPITLCIILLAFVSNVKAEEYNFSKDLSTGASGDDVVELQSWLISNGYDIPALSSGAASKGYFGSQTREAVRKFQEDEGLPNTGYFGRMSRGKIHEYWSQNADKRAPVINGIDAPTFLNIGETGTWVVRATDPQNGTLSYSVDWGETSAYKPVNCPDGYTCTPIAVNAGGIPLVQQGSTFTHAYWSKTPNTYKVRFTVKNNLGLSSQSSVTVKIGSIENSSLKVISPNGGEIWNQGTMQTIKWNSPAYFRATYADIKISTYRNCPTGTVCTLNAQVIYTIAKNISINQNSFSWKVGDYIPEVMTAIYPPVYPTVPNGQYIIQICETGTNNCDLSDRPFTIKSNNIPQVSSPNGGEVWLTNSSQPLRWTIPVGIDSMTRVDMYLDNESPCLAPAYTPGVQAFPRCLPAYTLDKNIPITMIYNWIVATDISNVNIPAGNYKFRVCTVGSTTECDSSDRAFVIQ